ncbi:MAG: hypothetical protein EU530_09860 [Promethearchaeota archaeon]|nr:MAG: hypothetical protein EU530_09860 [Candidatus Lokiarchaeota archaeon]
MQIDFIKRPHYIFLLLLFQWVEYTEDYFTKEDITKAIKICEEEPKYKENGNVALFYLNAYKIQP